MSYLSRDDIRIQVKIINSKNLLARATVILFGIWEEHGWRVMKSTKMHPQFGEEIWIQAPSYKTIKGRKEIVFINDRKTYDMVMEMIFDAYHMARSKKEGIEGAQNHVDGEETNELVVNTEAEEVNPDDIPF